jgi:hypothetical protein
MTETSDLPSDPSDGSSQEEAGLAGPGAGISATGRGPGDVRPGDEVGSDYGDPGGIETAVDQEMAGDGQRQDNLDGDPS